MFFNNGVLSDRDINRKLGKGIFIYPFREENLKGSTYNLTASSFAWIIENDQKKIIVDEHDNIVIPAGKTALIQTDESIYISKKFCGTCHSRVSLCNKGISSISTTLDPCYFGTSVIALNNNSNESITIKVGDSIASLMIYKMKTGADNLHDNFPFRKDLFDLEISDFYEGIWEYNKKNKCKNKQKKNKKKEKAKNKLISDLEDWKKQKWRTNKEQLIKQVRDYVLERDMEKKIFRLSLGFGLSGGVIMILLLYLTNVLDYEKFQGIIGGINATITCIPPTTALIIGIRIRYLKKGSI